LKKIAIFLLSLMMILTTMGCSKDSKDSKYTLETAKSNGDVIGLQGQQQINFEKLDLFAENVKNGTKGKVRITGFTTEGGAVITELEFDGKKIKYTYDSTRDGYGAQNIIKKDFKSDSLYKKDKYYYLKDSPNDILIY
jgi:hypothetical protein